MVRLSLFGKHITIIISIDNVAIEGFVLYAGGDYTLHLSIMLLVQVMAYVMSDMFAIDIVGH